MEPTPAAMDYEPLLRFLPEDRVGTVQAIESIVIGHCVNGACTL
jgi:hypothetical protein